MFNEPELQRQQTRQKLDRLRSRRRILDQKHNRIRAKLKEIAAEKQQIRTAIWKLQNPEKTAAQQARRYKKSQEPVQTKPQVPAMPALDPASYRPAWLDSLKPAAKPPDDVDNG